MKKVFLAGICASMIAPPNAFALADCAERFGYEFGSELSYNMNCFFGCKFYDACRQCIYTDKQTGLTQVRQNCPQNVTEDEKEVVAETEAESEEPPPTPKSKKAKAKTVVEEEEVDEQVEEEVKVESPKRVTMNPKKPKPIPDIELPPDLPPAQTEEEEEEEIKQQVEDAVEQELESVEPPPPPTPKSPPPEPKVIMAEVEQEQEQEQESESESESESSPGFFSKVVNFFSSDGGDGEKTDVSWKRTFNDDKDALIAKVRAECERNDVNPNFCEAIGWTETQFVPNLVSVAGAIGLLQMMPATATAYNCDPKQLTDVDVNIPCAVRLIVDLQKTYKGDYSLMASAYNAGEPATNYPSCLKRKKGCANTFKQTIEYVARVNAIMSILEGRPVCDSHDCIIFKPNAQADGPTDPLLLDLMVELQNEVPAFLWVSGCNDIRKVPSPPHDAGIACDITIFDQRYESIAYKKVDEVIAKMGMTSQLKVLKNPKGRGATAPHVHIELKQNATTATTVMASATNNSKPTMFVIGDSLAVGLCLAWDTKANCKAKTGAFLRRIPVEAIPTNLPADTTLVFWAGTNDAVADWGAFDMLQHINGIMSQLSKHKGKVVWVKIPNARPDMQARIDKLNMMIETANENFSTKVKVLDVPTENKGRDMVHFTQQGYNNISQLIEKET